MKETKVYNIMDTIEVTDAEMKQFVSTEIIRIGFAPSYGGFRYFKEIIYIALEKNDVKLMKLYEHAAKICGTKVAPIERSIRTLIEKSHTLNGKFKPLYDFFGVEVKKYPPAIGDILALMLEYIRLSLLKQRLDKKENSK